MPRTGTSENFCKTSVNAWDSDRGDTASVIPIRPVNRMPKPISIMPTPFVFWFLTNLRSIIPPSTASGANVEGLNISRNTAPLEFISIRRIIWAVMVVPMFAPRTMLIDCLRLSMPAPIRPTVSTIVAVELCITLVTRVPVSMPSAALWVTFSSMLLRALLELLLRPSPIMSIPYKNMESPPRSEITEKIPTL